MTSIQTDRVIKMRMNPARKFITSRVLSKMREKRSMDRFEPPS
jgi:hypothetical protein